MRDENATRIPKTAALRGDSLPDAAEPDDAELLVAQVGAEHEVERESLPRTASRQAIAFDDAPRHAEDERPRQIGGRFGQHVRRVGDHDVVLARRRHIDVVVADGDRRHDLEVAPGLEDGSVDRVSDDRQQPLLSRHARHELVVRKVALPIHVDLAGSFELREHSGRNSSGNENGGFDTRLAAERDSRPHVQCP